MSTPTPALPPDGSLSWEIDERWIEVTTVEEQMQGERCYTKGTHRRRPIWEWTNADGQWRLEGPWKDAEDTA